MDTNRYISFGLGGPAAGLYTKIEVEPPVPWRHIDVIEAARQAAVATYGTAWAFDYSETTFLPQIEQYGLKLRETIRVSADGTAKVVQPS
jgi:hypothetical protein